MNKQVLKIDIRFAGLDRGLRYAKPKRFKDRDLSRLTPIASEDAGPFLACDAGDSSGIDRHGTHVRLGFRCGSLCVILSFNSVFVLSFSFGDSVVHFGHETRAMNNLEVRPHVSG
jgi:hypothetical protein